MYEYHNLLKSYFMPCLTISWLVVEWFGIFVGVFVGKMLRIDVIHDCRRSMLRCWGCRSSQLLSYRLLMYTCRMRWHEITLVWTDVSRHVEVWYKQTKLLDIFVYTELVSTNVKHTLERPKLTYMEKKLILLVLLLTIKRGWGCAPKMVLEIWGPL